MIAFSNSSHSLSDQNQSEKGMKIMFTKIRSQTASTRTKREGDPKEIGALAGIKYVELVSLFFYFSICIRNVNSFKLCSA